MNYDVQLNLQATDSGSSPAYYYIYIGPMRKHETKQQSLECNEKVTVEI